MSLLRILPVALVVAMAAQAADETLVLAPVFPAAQTARQSYLRFANLNLTSGSGVVTVTVKNEAGTTLGTWTKQVFNNTSPQVGMAEIEAALTTKPAANAQLRLEMTANFYGYVQHAIYNPVGGALTNLSNCGSRIVNDPRILANVHTSLLLNNYPSSVVIANRGTTAGAATLDIFDSVTGAKLGVYTSADIPAGGHVSVPEKSIEQAIGFTPNATQYHLTVKLTGAFIGALEHLVDNFGAGAVTDMTQRCALRGIPTDSYPERNITPKLSSVGIWTPIDQPDFPLSFPHNRPIRLGAQQRQGLSFSGFKFDTLPKASSPFAPVKILLLEQQDDGTLQIATSKYISDDTINGTSQALVADFNGDGKEDLLLPAHNEHPSSDKSSTLYLSKTDGTFSKVDLGDSVRAHGANLFKYNGQFGFATSNVQTAAGQSPSIYLWNGTGGFTSGGVAVKPADAFFGSAGGNVVADFLGNGQLQIAYSDTYTNIAYQGKYAINVIFPFENDKVFPLPVLPQPAFVLPTPYFNDKPQYAGYTNIYDSNGRNAKTHNARLFAQDFNNDGKLDLMVQAFVFPGAPLAGAKQTSNRPLGKIQMLQNKGGGSFVDVTDTYNPDWNINGGSDESPTYFYDDAGSYLGQITQGVGARSTTDIIMPGTGGNRTILNDGTGRLHLVLQDELYAIAEQVNNYMGRTFTALCCIGTSGDVKSSIRLIPYLTDAGTYNFLGMLDSKQPNTTGGTQRYVMVNVPLDLNPTVDFRKNITITDRNGSKRIRTFGGDDVINKNAGDPDARIDGGVGRDKVVYAGARAGYTIAKQADGTYTIKDNATGGTTDTLINVETVQFADVSVDLY